MYDDIRLSRPGLAVDTIHDGRHKLEKVAFSRESIPYTLHIPELKIAAFTYTWVNSDSEAGAAIALYGPGVGEKPFQERIADRKVDENMDFSDWQIETFSMKQDLNFRKADVSWETEAAAIKFRFDAIHPPYSYGSHAGGCPSFCAIDRIEQAGFVEGEIRIGDKLIPFNTLGHRDHSWGIRKWKAFQFYHWFEGKSKDGSIAVHFWRYLAFGEEHIRGYVLKGGAMAEITAVDTEVSYEELWQKEIQLSVRDDMGRQTSVKANFYAHHPLIPSPEIELREAAGTAEYDGEPGLAWLEVGWPSDYLEVVKTDF